MKFLRNCSAALFLSAGLQLGARADVTFGGNARAFAMGGAGIAIVDRSERNTNVNPAALALYNRRIQFGFPSIGLRASGISLRAALQNLTSNPDQTESVRLARDFGSRPSDFGVSLSWGARFGHIDSYATGIAIVHVVPNAALENWAKTANGDTTKLTGSEQADLLGAAIYALPSIGLAERISPGGSPTRVEVGARVKLSRAVYSHYIVTSANIMNGTPAAPAPELGNGTTITKDGVGADFGLLVHPTDHAGLSGALVLFNVVNPNFNIHGTDSSGAPTLYHLQPTSVSVGSAYERGRALAAFDVVDITRAYGDVQARLGVEYKTRAVAWRAGYASSRGFTVGFGWRFLNLAFGAKAPLELTETLRF